MQYRDANPKTEILVMLRKKYPMTYGRFYKIWRGQEVHMIEWHQPISNSMVTLSQNVSTPEETEFRGDKVSSPQLISDSSNIVSEGGTTRSFRGERTKSRVSDSSTIYSPIKKVGDVSGLYSLMEQSRIEIEEAECETEMFLSSN